MKFVARHDGRADAVVAAELPGTSRKRLAALFAGGDVIVDGRRARKGDAVSAGASIELRRLPETDDDRRPVPQPELACDVETVHADDDLVAINKPALWPTHPLASGERGTAANWLVAAYPETNGVGDDPREAGWVHRLDRGTSGVLVGARHRDAWLACRDQFRKHHISKTYLALVRGAAADGGSRTPLSQRGTRSVADSARGLDAETSWRVSERLIGATLLECTARTGRMHQIRVHLALAGHPIVGDALYGDTDPPEALDAHFLHASSIELVHPTSGEALTVEAPLPANRRAILGSLRDGD